MIVAQIKVTDGLTQPLERFGAAAPGMLDKVLRGAGYRYRAFLKKNYLSGQMLGRESGNLVRSLYVGKKKGQRHLYLVGSRAVTSTQDFGGVVIKRRDAAALKLANIYEHAGGYVIKPKKAKVLVFGTSSGIFFSKEIHGRQRPFMSASAAAFGWGDAFDAELDKVLAGELKKAGLAGATK